MKNTKKTLIRLPKVIEKVSVGKTTIWDRVAAGTFPLPIKVGPRTTVWIEEEIDEWIEDEIAKARGGVA